MTKIEKDLLETCIQVLDDENQLGTASYRDAKEYVISVAKKYALKN